MIDYIYNGENQNLILFIHGFTGGSDTWKHPDHDSFVDLMAQDPEISSHFDIASVEYYTRLTDMFSTAENTGKLLKKLFKRSHGKRKKNINVDEISNALRTELKYKFGHYENLIVIAHSMGGLIAKSCILKDVNEGFPSKVRLFLSLAVPHSGSSLATFGKLVSSNLQIKDLTPFNEFASSMTDQWLKTELRPETKYFYGVHDSIVPKTSAVPSDKKVQEVIALDENHESISKPEGVTSTTFISVRKHILDYVSSDPGVSKFELVKLESDDECENELFVLKLLIGDINRAAIRDAKEVFLNAEYMRKIFTDDSDKKRLADLYEKIRAIYKAEYKDFLHDGIANSGQLLASVDKQIINHDREFLKTMIPLISAMHKQGMLHQLANQSDEEIWWTKDGSIEKIDSYLQEINDEAGGTGD